MRKLAQSHRRQSGSPVLRESDLPAMRTHSEPLNRNGVNPHWSKADSTERVALTVFHALPGPMAVRDAQDLMAYPFFSLAKTKRVTPIHFRAGSVAIDVEATSQFGMATIWDADVLIWAASQLVEARDRGLPTSRLMVVTPYEILTFGRRGTSARAYQRLKAALDRLQSTSIATSIRQPTARHISSSRVVSSDGSIDWFASMPVDNRQDGASISGICTPSREAALPTAISQSIYGLSSLAKLYPGTNFPCNAAGAERNCSSDRRNVDPL
jgi:hypothetical protein